MGQGQGQPVGRGGLAIAANPWTESRQQAGTEVMTEAARPAPGVGSGQGPLRNCGIRRAR